MGTWCNIDNVFSTRLLGRSGFPWVVVDMEHSAIDWNMAATLFGFLAEAGVVPLCRVPNGTHENIKRALDAGAWGIVAPMVDTVEQATAIVAACRYPPMGTRSIGGGSHLLSFGTDDATYKARANGEVLVVLQTESPTGVRNAPAIYAVPGVDAIFVGPMDLKWQMRSELPGGREATPAEFEAMLSKVLEAGKATGTPVGLHTFSVEDCKARVAQGFQFVALLSDAGFLAAATAAAVASLGPALTGGVRGGGLGKY